MKVGFSKVCITPPIGVHLEGYSGRTFPSIGVHDDLYATTLVIEINGERIALISCDLIGLPVEFVKTVKEKISIQLGIPAANVLIAATHTHSGPVMLGLQRSDELIERWKEALPDYIVGNVRAAIRSSRDGVIAYGLGSVAYVGKNRRTPNGPVDPQLSVLHFKALDGEELGAVINYTCHGTVLDHKNLLISSDYIGYLREYLNKVRGSDIPVLFFNGAEGDINIGYSADLSALGKEVGRERTFRIAEKMGKVLAFNAAGLIEEMDKYRAISKMETLVKKVQIETRKPRNEDLLKKAIANTSDPLELYYLKEELKFAGGNPPDKIAIDLQLIRLDELCMFAIPGEPFVEIGLKLKKHASPLKSMVIGLANGWVGYIPTQRAYGEVGYETRLGRWSYLEKDAGENIIGSFLNMLKQISMP